MAVNDNDRVTSRRLKQFWDLAKPWIQSLVSGAIDTSETAMESSMDTKIQAAKPNYNMPNENDQIGAGYGYNDMVGNYANYGASISFDGIYGFFAQVTENAPFPGNPAIGAQIKYMTQTLFATNKYTDFYKAFLKGFEGKLVGIPLEMINDENFTSIAEFISDLNNFKSVYNEEENSLVSPVYTFGNKTYQTKLVHETGKYLKVYYSVNEEEYTYTSNNPSMAWCASFNNMPFNIGSCDMPDKSVSDKKISDYAVKPNHLSNDTKRLILYTTSTIRRYYEPYHSGTPTVKFPGQTVAMLNYYHTRGSYSSSGAYAVDSFSFFGTKEQLTENSYSGSNNPNPVLTLDPTNSTISVPAKLFNRETVSPPKSYAGITSEGELMYCNGAAFCIMSIETETQNKIYFGRLIFDSTSPVTSLTIKVLDPDFFTDFTSGSTLYVQSISNPSSNT